MRQSNGSRMVAALNKGQVPEGSITPQRPERAMPVDDDDGYLNHLGASAPRPVQAASQPHFLVRGPGNANATSSGTHRTKAPTKDADLASTLFLGQTGRKVAAASSRAPPLPAAQLPNERAPLQRQENAVRPLASAASAGGRGTVAGLSASPVTQPGGLATGVGHVANPFPTQRPATQLYDPAQRDSRPDPRAYKAPVTSNGNPYMQVQPSNNYNSASRSAEWGRVNEDIGNGRVGTATPPARVPLTPSLPITASSRQQTPPSPPTHHHRPQQPQIQITRHGSVGSPGLPPSSLRSPLLAARPNGGEALSHFTLDGNDNAAFDRDPLTSSPMFYGSRKEDRAGSRDRGSPAAGFTNLGNTCFAGATLSMLLRCPQFADGLLAVVRDGPPPPPPPPPRAPKSESYLPHWCWQRRSPTPPPSPTVVSTDVFRVHRGLSALAASLRARARHVSPAGLQHSFSAFFDFDEHDAHEFLVMLLAALEGEALAASPPPASLAGGNKGATVTDDVGAFAVESSVTTEPADYNQSAATVASATVSNVPPQWPTWVQRLTATRLLRTVCCRRGVCNHSLGVKEDMGVLSVALPQPPPRAASPAAPPAATPVARLAPHSMFRQTTLPFPSAVALPPAPVAAPKKPPPPPPTVTELLRRSLSEHQLDTYKCDACHSSEAQFERSGLLHPLPPLVLVHLLRFETRVVNGVFTVSKVTLPVNVGAPLVIDGLSPEATTVGGGDDDDNSEAGDLAGSEGRTTRKRPRSGRADAAGRRNGHGRTRYRLVGVVRHIGRSADTGHYVAEVLERSSNAGQSGANGGAARDRWVRVNDSCATDISDVAGERHAASKDAYLLLYQRQDDARSMPRRAAPQGSSVDESIDDSGDEGECREVTVVAGPDDGEKRMPSVEYVEADEAIVHDRDAVQVAIAVDAARGDAAQRNAIIAEPTQESLDLFATDDVGDAT